MRKMLYVLLMLLFVVGTVNAYNTRAYSITGDDGPVPAYTNGSKLEWQYVFGAAGDIRSNLGTPGKNIAAYQNNVVVIWADTMGYNPDSGYVLGYLRTAYSTDGGATWTTPFNLTTYPMVRYYPGVTFDQVTGKVWFVWQEGPLGYPNSLIKVATDMEFPYGVFRVWTMDTTLNNNVWVPAIDVNSDTIIVVGVDIGYGGTFDAYYWMSIDGGNTWSTQRVLHHYTVGQDTLISRGQDVPIPRIGPNGYVAFYGQHINIYGADTVYAPYFIDAHIDGDSLVVDRFVDIFTELGGPLYPGATGWWYTYDFVLDANNKPHIVVKFGTGSYEYGDVWHIYPTTGSPGSWGGWQADLLVGYGNGTPVATQPNVAFVPPTNKLLVIYKAKFQGDSTNPSGVPDIGHGMLDLNTNEWTDLGPVGQVDDADEEAVELARIVFTDHGYATGLIDRSADVLEVGYLQVPMGIEEEPVVRNVFVLAPVRTLTRGEVGVKFSLPKSGNVTVSVFDAAGRKVATIYNGIMEAGSHTLTWNAPKTGVYFVNLNFENTTATTRVIAVR